MGNVGHRAFRWIVLSVLAANVAWFCWNLRSLLHRASDPHQMYGRAFPRLRATDAYGQLVRWDGRWTLLLMLTPDSDEGLRNARYARLLLRRFAAPGLAVVAIVRADVARVRALGEDMGFSYPLIADAEGYWWKQLALSTHPFGLFVVDPAGKVRFATTKARPQDMRQLVEKHLLGTISYAPPNEVRRLEVGMKFPALIVEDVRKGGQTRVEGSQTIIFFTGRCSSCSLAAYLASASSLELGARERTERPPMLIFSPWFSPQEIRENALRLVPRADLYIAPEGIPGIEDGYYGQVYFPHSVLLITTDARGTITEIRPVGGEG